MSDEISRILIVDDSPELREILTIRLKNLGYQVLSARSGRESLEIMAAQHVDLLLLDILMPEMSGYQVLEAVKADPDLRHISVIVISAISEMDSVARCIQLGADDYLQKPFNGVLLKARLEASLERKRLREQHQALLNKVNSKPSQAERIHQDNLPASIEGRLKAGEKIIADRYSAVTVLYTELIGLNVRAERYSPQALVSEMNKVLAFIHETAESFGLELIKTLGDQVFLVSGVPEPREDHAFAAANAALALLAENPRLTWNGELPLSLRCGLHSGPVVAGVIGTQKLSYDVWGQTIALASCLPSLCEPGKILVSETTYQLLRNHFAFRMGTHLTTETQKDIATFYLDNPLA